MVCSSTFLWRCGARQHLQLLRSRRQAESLRTDVSISCLRHLGKPPGAPCLLTAKLESIFLVIANFEWLFFSSATYRSHKWLFSNRLRWDPSQKEEERWAREPNSTPETNFRRLKQLIHHKVYQLEKLHRLFEEVFINPKIYVVRGENETFEFGTRFILSHCALTKSPSKITFVHSIVLAFLSINSTIINLCSTALTNMAVITFMKVSPSGVCFLSFFSTRSSLSPTARAPENRSLWEWKRIEPLFLTALASWNPLQGWILSHLNEGTFRLSPHLMSWLLTEMFVYSRFGLVCLCAIFQMCW